MTRPIPPPILKKLLLAVGVASLLSLTFLTDPLDRVYNEQTLDQDLTDILAYQAPDSSAYRAISHYLLVTAFSDEPLGKTYRQIVALDALWEEQQQRREAAVQAREELAAREEERHYASLREIVSVNLTGREVALGDSATSITYFYTLKNRSRKPIRAVQGFVGINHGLHGYALGIDLLFDPPLAARSSRREKITFQVSSGNVPGEHEAATLEWRPEMILFEDGEKRE